MKRILFLILALVTISPAFAQNATAPVAPKKEPTALEQRELDIKAKAESDAIAEKAKKEREEAAAKLDNKNPVAIEKSEDRERISEAFVAALMVSQQVTAQQQKADRYLAPFKQELEEANKRLNTILAEYQKSHHAEGCDLTPPHPASPEKPKDHGLTWDCANAANNAPKK